MFINRKFILGVLMVSGVTMTTAALRATDDGGVDALLDADRNQVRFEVLPDVDESRYEMSDTKPEVTLFAEVPRAGLDSVGMVGFLKGMGRLPEDAA